MTWVYVIGFKGDRFLMVHNTKRAGWEMPGGKVEAGESPAEAAVREFREESGLRFIPYAGIDHQDGMVFAGEVINDGGSGEMDWMLFKDLPERLAFPAVEYVDQVEWAKDVVTRRRMGVQLGNRHLRGVRKSSVK